MVDQTITTLVYPDSLGDTLDAVNAAFFNQQPLPEHIRSEAAAWIADRQGLPRAYSGMFAPTDYDFAFGALTFTGEVIRSGAATGHILSEEACRALFQLGVETEEVKAALLRARRGIFRRLAESEVQGIWAGVYCCGPCSVSLWRHLMVSGEPDDARRLETGLAELRRHRNEQGRWKRFPFYYTLLALAEIELPAARDEIEHAAPVMERLLKRMIKGNSEEVDERERRRRIILERALARC